jgi:hypothetical protein
LTITRKNAGLGQRMGVKPDDGHLGDTQPFFNFISNIEYESSKDYLRLIKYFNES